MSVKSYPAKQVMRIAIWAEGAIILVSLLWALLRKIDLPLRPSLYLIGVGLLAVLPLLLINFLVFEFLIRHRTRPSKFKDFRDEYIAPLCSNLTPLYAFMIGMLSGIGEELFFRGAILTEFSRLGGLSIGIIASSVLFGYVHFIGLVSKYWQILSFYICFGVYFAALTVHENSLIPSIIAHWGYNFVAILYIRARVNTY